jgi:sucrose phosphorylase
MLNGPLDGVFDGVHMLPYYTPYDGADAGFDPQDHTSVDPRLGTWDDVVELSRDAVVMSDVIVNHVSDESAMYRDVEQRGEASPWAPMFLTRESVFPDGASDEDLARLSYPKVRQKLGFLGETADHSLAPPKGGTPTEGLATGGSAGVPT